MSKRTSAVAEQTGRPRCRNSPLRRSTQSPASASRSSASHRRSLSLARPTSLGSCKKSPEKRGDSAGILVGPRRRSYHGPTPVRTGESSDILEKLRCGRRVLRVRRSPNGTRGIAGEGHAPYTVGEKRAHGRGACPEAPLVG